jgi:ribosome maturation factor RimP
MDVAGLVRPVVESAGLELVDVAFGREGTRRVLRVSVDREGGVDLDAIAEVSERIGRRLDLEGFAPGPYYLEVGSPGVERPLRDPRDFARHVGERVKVKASLPEGTARTFTGTLTGADEAQVRVLTEEGEQAMPYERIASARTVFEWGAKDVKR